MILGPLLYSEAEELSVEKLSDTSAMPKTAVSFACTYYRRVRMRALGLFPLTRCPCTLKYLVCKCKHAGFKHVKFLTFFFQLEASLADMILEAGYSCTIR